MIRHWSGTQHKGPMTYWSIISRETHTYSSLRTTLSLLKAIEYNVSILKTMPYCHLPNFEAALPRLVANNNVVSFPVPLVPQPLHRGIARGAGWVFGGGIFGQTLAASIILFLAGCFEIFLKEEEVSDTSL